MYQHEGDIIYVSKYLFVCCKVHTYFSNC